MKKYVNKLKRIVAVILSMALVISLFQSDILRTFADENATTPVLDFVPEGATLEENKMNEPYPVAYVKNNEITLYEDYTAEAPGAVFTGAQGEQIELANSYTYTTGEEKVILYQYTWHDTEGVMYTAYSDYFRFISADDISFTEVEKPETTPVPTPEVTASPEITPNPTPEVIPTATPGATQAPEGETITLDFVPNDPYANSVPATEKYAVINDTTIRVYQSPDYQAEGVELTVNAGTVIELVTAYTYSDEQVVYRYDYNGVENSALYNAALSELSGYPIIPAKYITVGVETVENTTITDPDTSVSVTGLLPKTAELDTVPTTTAELPEGTDITDINENALFYDFTLSNGGAYFEPSSTVKVTFPDKNLNFAQGTEYTIYHVADNGEVTTLGTETYVGGDIQVDVEGFSYIGLSADVDFVDIEDFRAQFTVNPVTLYADTALENGKEFTTADTDIITVEMKAIANDGNNKVELYVISYNGYEGENSEMKEAITPSSGMAYAYVRVGDVKEYVETEEQPEEVVNAYENLIKSPTADEFEKLYYVAYDNGYTESFTDEQWTEIGRVGNLLTTMEESTKDLEEYSLQGAPYVEGAKLYLNPVTWPDEYVTLSMEAMATSLDIQSVVAENAVVEGEYTAENGDEYYIIDTSSWEDFANKRPYKYIIKENFVFENKWTNVNKTAAFLKGDVKVYDHSLSTYYQLDNGKSLDVFNVLYSFVTVESGIETKWYVIETDNWTDANGNTVRGKFVKAADTYIVTAMTDASGVAVEGDIPEGSTLSVSTVSAADTELADGIYVIGENSLFYDVTLLDAKDNETQPGEGGITVTFPESAVLASGLAVGDKYHVYHVHDGIVEMSEVKTYNGGNIEMSFSNLSAVGISEIETKTNLESMYGVASDPEGFTRQVVYLDDFITLYEHFEGDVAYAELTGYQNTEIEIYNEITFTDTEGNVSDFKLYQFSYYGETGTDLYNILNAYQFISSEDISFTEIEVNDTATEELYNKLMATETIEEWLEVEKALTEEEWKIFHLMDDAMQAEIDAHYRSLPTAVEKAYIETTTRLIAATTVAEYAELLKNITPEVDAMILANREMEDQLIAHIDALVALEDTSPKNVIEYTNVAPFVQPAIVSEPATTYSLLRSRSLPALFASSEESSTETPVVNADGVVTNKNVVLKSDGVYTVTLESYVTGSKVTQKVEKYIPTDIIVVVDQSGSMENDMSGYEYKDYKDINANLTASDIYGNYSNYKTRNNTYIKIGNEYVKVTVERGVVTSVPDYNAISSSNSNYHYYNTYGDSGSLYYKNSNDEYIKVYVNRSGSIGDRTYTYRLNSNDGEILCTSTDTFGPPQLNGVNIQFYSQITTEVYNYTFTYTDADGNSVTHAYDADDVIPTGSESPAVAGGKYYYAQAITEHRLDALTRALTNFADSVEGKTAGKDGEKGTEDDVNHRIAIVGFSSDGYNNTEILTGCTINPAKALTSGTRYYPDGQAHNGVQYENTTAYTNATKTALVDMNTSAGQTSVKNAIDALTAHGGTQTDHGMDMALDIWAAEATKGTKYTETVDGVTTTVRNKVVILFTDGKPTGEGSNFNNSVANDAIAYSKTIKNTYNATVYTIGIFDNANGTINVTNNGQSASLPNNLSNENIFAHYVSSNFKTAQSMSNDGDGETFHKDTKTNMYTGKSYYLSADNSEALNNIFTTISEDVENESQVYELDETTVIKDIVAPNFSVPANATNVKVYTAATKGMTGTTPTFDTRVDVSGDVDISINDDDVDVKGFDFAENWVGTETASDGKITYHGKELIIEFDIPVDEDFIGGNKVKTNGDDSGIYVPDLNEDGSQKVDENGKPKFTLVENFTRPTVDIALKNITAQWQNQNIYRTNNADIKSLFTAATINGKAAATVINGENNAYVDIVFTITGPNGEIAKYTINAGDRFAEGGWNDESGLTPALTEDTEYTLAWTVTPIHEGTYGVVSGAATATVYVYKPVVTFKDSTDYFGDIITYGSGVNYIDNSEVWKHGETFSTAVTMSGTKPTVTVTYEQNPTGTENGIIVTTSDIPVQATVTITNENNVDILGVEETHYTVIHAQCDDSDCTYRSNAKEEFVVHVNTVSLNVSKEVTGSTNTSGEFKVVVAFEGNNFDKELKILEDNADATLNVVDGKASLNLTLTHGQTVKLANLPIGRYTVTEDDYSARYDTTVTGGTMVSDRSAYTDLASGKVEDTIAFVNELKAGYLTIKKVIEMPKGFVASTTDDFTIVVKQGDTQIASVTLKNGETCSPIELVAGTYTVIETVKGTLYGDHASQNHTVTIEAGKTTETTVTNPAKTGSLEVSKTIVNEAVNYDATKDTFAVKVKVDGYTGTALDYTIGGETKSASVAQDGYVTITLAHDQSALFEGLLANVTYNVMEVLSTDQQIVYKTPVITNGTSAIIAGDTQEATITNTVKTGTLVIDKNISLPAGVSVADGETFAFTVTGPDFNRNVSIAKDGQTTIENLLVGEYTVDENLDTDQQKIYTTSYSPEGGEATVLDSETTTVTVTNTVTAGKLEITKNVVDKAENISSEKKFTVEITLAGDIVINSLKGTVAGAEQTVPVRNGKATVLLAHEQTASFTNIPVGVTYTVTEKGVDTNYYSVSYENEQGSISATTAPVTVTNTRKYGKLTITKVVKDDKGITISANPGETFLFTVTDGRDFEMQVVIAPEADKPGSDSVTLSNLPIGNYTVTEDTSWSYKYDSNDSTTSATTSVTVTEDGQATITNVLKTDKWLKADAYVENVFNPVVSTDSTAD